VSDDDFIDYLTIERADICLTGSGRRLLVSRVDTERLIQPTEAGCRVESKSERPNESQQAGLPFPLLERADSHDGQQDGEQCAGETVAATDVLFCHTGRWDASGLCISHSLCSHERQY
jgi:hypothetical protein